ncbi:MAG: hypothetical protein AAFY29_20780 [Pseudomonadota bacterium]
MSQTPSRLLAPAKLEEARRLSHAAIQWASRAARANLPALADDSHSNLGWSHVHTALLSHRLDGDHQLGFSFAHASLLWVRAGEVSRSQPVSDLGDAALGAVCDSWLNSAGLQSATPAPMPYQLDAVHYRPFQDREQRHALETLGVWFAAAHSALETLIAEFGDGAPGTLAPRCWPHHFDLATLFALEEGDPEHARSVGVGLSPGDAAYQEPYLYCSPWPVAEELPPSPAEFHWHTDGFTSLVCPVSRLGSAEQLAPHVREAFVTVYASLV